MFDNTAEDDHSRRSIISLEDGADEWQCDEHELDISERGMCFHSRCRFPLGTELAVVFCSRTEDQNSRRVRTEGIVVGCEELCARCYRITLMFLDLPEDLRAQLAVLAGERAGEETASRWWRFAG